MTEYHEAHEILGLNSGAPEGLAVPAPLVVNVFLETRCAHFIWCIGFTYISNASLETFTSTQTTRYHKGYHQCFSLLSVNIFLSLFFFLFFVFYRPFQHISAISWRPVLVVEEAGVPGKLYHLRLRFECTLFVIYKVGRKPTPYWWIGDRLVWVVR